VQDTVIEIKCPSRGIDKTIKELMDSGYEHLKCEEDGQVILKETSHYYCQAQGEMAIKGCKLCHLVVWTPIDMEVISVPFNELFWDTKLLPKLKFFFASCIRSKLLFDIP